MSYTADFTITQISASNAQYNKVAGVDQIPVVLSIPGPISLREKSSAYTVTLGTKQI